VILAGSKWFPLRWLRSSRAVISLDGKGDFGGRVEEWKSERMKEWKRRKSLPERRR